MAIDTKHEDLKGLQIDRTALPESPEPRWSRRFILGGIAIVVLLGIVVTTSRLFSSSAPEVEVARATAESASAPGVVLSAGGYIVAHHKINANSKVTGRVAWIGVEKGDKVKEGQVLVRLEDQEFRAQVEQTRGDVASAKARLEELVNGSRPEEIQQAQHNLEEARANLVNDKANLERVEPLYKQGVFSKQQMDEALAKYEASVNRMNSLEQTLRLAKIGPRKEQIDRARGDLGSAEGRLAYAVSQLDATVIRAPVTGTILERKAEKGELVTAQFASQAEGGPQGSAVALADLNDLQVELDIAQGDFARLGPHQKGVITTDAYPDRKYEGVIAEVSPEADRQKATVQVKVQILHPDDYLRPEMNANVQFISEDSKDASASSGVFVPTNGVRDRDGKKFVLLVFNGRAVARDVKIGKQRSNGFLVEGLTGGENVITQGPADLKDGDRVRIKGQ